MNTRNYMHHCFTGIKAWWHYLEFKTVDILHKSCRFSMNCTQFYIIHEKMSYNAVHVVLSISIRFNVSFSRWTVFQSYLFSEDVLYNYLFILNLFSKEFVLYDFGILRWTELLRKILKEWCYNCSCMGVNA